MVINNNSDKCASVLYTLEYRSIDDLQNLFLFRMMSIIITDHFNNNNIEYVNNRFINRNHHI